MMPLLLPLEVTIPANPTGWDIFASEFLGTLVLILLGAGVCATNNLAKSKGRGGGWLMITIGWGLAVYMGVYAAWKTGGHLNPAVTIAKVVAHIYDPSVTLNGAVVGSGGIPVTFGNVTLYIVAQFAGAILGAILAFLAFKKQFDSSEDVDPGLKLGIFSTAPEVRSYAWNFITEVIATFVLIAFVLVAGGTPAQVGPLAVALIIVVIGASLGGPTGYAINPARDLGPRIAHAILPIKGKGTSDWGYAWIPVFAPIVGAILAVVVVYALGMQAV